MSTVFISYRRENTAGEARALFNDLTARVGEDSVFMDVDSIALGRDFRSVLQETTASCDLMLVMIGRNWADFKDDRGRTRLENPGDYVRLEIETALKRNIAVTPVLVQGARMPAPEELPTEIQDLAYRNGFELSHNRWESDVEEMLRRLRVEVPGEDRRDHRPPAPREVATSGNSIATRTGSVPPQAKSGRWRVWVAACALIIAGLGGGLALYQYMTRSHQQDLATPTPSEPTAGFKVADYLGAWTRADPNSGGSQITWISVHKEDQGLVAQVRGRCPGPDCEWGTVPATTVGQDVKSSAEAPINSIGATFARGLRETQLTLRLVATDKLTAHVDTHSQSGRPDFEATNQFVRVVTAVPVVNPPPSISSDAQASAADYEKRGFVSLLDQNFDQAFKDFNEAARLSPDLHNVQEIRDLLRRQKVPLQTNDPASWKTLFSTILEKYSWGMPAEVRSQMQAKL